MDLVSLTRVLLSFGFVITLMLLIAWAFKRFGLDKQVLARSSKHGSLALEETLYIDRGRRVVIISRGEKKHLVLLGAAGQHDVLLESYAEAEDMTKKNEVKAI